MSANYQCSDHYGDARNFHRKSVEHVMKDQWELGLIFLSLAIRKLKFGAELVQGTDFELQNRFQLLLEEWEMELNVILNQLEENVTFDSNEASPSTSDETHKAASLYCFNQLQKCGELSNTSNDSRKVLIQDEMMLWSEVDRHANFQCQVENQIQRDSCTTETNAVAAVQECTEGDDDKDQPVTGDARSKNELEIDQYINDFKSLAERGMPPIKLADIVGYDNIKNLINQLFVLPKLYPQHFGQNRELQHILLYGEPGCGKTCFAAAISQEFGNCQFILITPFEINGKYIGESEKRLKALFTYAENAGRTAIFFDELDGLLPSRSAPGNVGFRALVTQFFVLTEGVYRDPKDILLIAATNLPMNVDEGVLRRFKKRIYVGLPEAKTREGLFVHYYGKPQYDRIAKECNSKFFEELLDRYTCADVKEFAATLKEVPFLKAMECNFFAFKTHYITDWGEVVENKWIPSNAFDEDAEARTFTSIPPADLFLLPPVLNPDFYAVARCMKPTACMPTNDILKPASMTDQLQYYRQNGSCTEMLQDYFKTYDAKLTQAANLFKSFEEKYNFYVLKSNSNSDEALVEVKDAGEKVLSMLDDIGTSEELTKMKSNIKQCLDQMIKSAGVPKGKKITQEGAWKY